MDQYNFKKSSKEYNERLKLSSLISKAVKDDHMHLFMKDGQVAASLGGNYFFFDEDRGLDDIKTYMKMFTENELCFNIADTLIELKELFPEEFDYYMLCLNDRKALGDYKEEKMSSEVKEYVVYRTPSNRILVDWNGVLWKYGYPECEKFQCEELERGFSKGGRELVELHTKMRIKYMPVHSWEDMKEKYLTSRDKMDEETEKKYVEDCFDLYEKEGFSSVFFSPFDQYKGKSGQRIEIIGRCNTETVDLCALPMWEIKFPDGTQTQAGPEEIIPNEMRANGCPFFDEKKTSIDNLIDKAKETKQKNAENKYILPKEMEL